MKKIILATIVASIATASLAIKNKDGCSSKPIFAKNPKTETVVEFPSSCDVPTGWSVTSEEAADWQAIKGKASSYYDSSSKYVKGVWDESSVDRHSAKSYVETTFSSTKDAAKTKFNDVMSGEGVNKAKESASMAWSSFKGLFGGASGPKDSK